MLIAGVFGVIVVMFAYLAVRERAKDIDNAKMHLLHVSEKIAAEQRSSVESADHFLLEIMRLPQVRAQPRLLDRVQTAPDEGCSRLLAEKMREAPGIMNIVVAAANGDTRCNVQQPTNALNIADRKYFREALETRARAVSDVVISRGNGRPTIAVARPLEDPDGIVRGVVLVALDLEWLNEELGKSKLPANAHVGLLDANGTILARYPVEEGWIGSDFSRSDLFRAIVANSGHGSEGTVELNGAHRIVAFTPFIDTIDNRITLWLSVPQAAIVAQSEREFAWTGGVTMSLLLIMLLTVWKGGERIFLRPFSALSEAARRLALGDLDARTGLPHGGDECGQVARAFDRMAETIQLEKIELGRVSRALHVLSSGNRALLRATDEATLLQQICGTVVETGGYRMAWAGYAQQDEAKSVLPVASCRVPEEFLAALRISWADTERGRGPAGTAIRTAAPVIVRNMQTDPDAQPWRELAQRYQYGSVLALPLSAGQSIVGVLTIYATESDAFNLEEKELLVEAAADLSYGINALRMSLKRMQLEESLKTAEERFRAAAEANLDALCILKCVRDADARIVDFVFTDVNRSAEQLFGRAREHLVGERLGEIDALTVNLFDTYVQVASGGDAVEEEVALDANASGARWLRQQVVRVGDGVAVSLRDVTAWKQAGTRIRESEARYRELFDSNPHPMWVYELSSLRFLMVNDAAVKHYGYSRDEFLAMTIADIRPAEDVPRVLTNIASVQDGLADEAGVWVHRTKEGRLIDVEITSHVLYVGERRAEIVLAHDVTMQRQAQAALRKSEQKFRALFEQSPAGMVIIDAKTGYPAEFNDVAHEQLGYSREEFARLKVSDYEALEGVEEIRAHTKEILDKGGDDFETQHRTKSGEIKNVHVLMRVLGHAEERLIYCIYQDVTEKRRGEIALRRANRALLTLSAVNEELVRAPNEQALLQAVCRIVAEKGMYPFAGICYAQHDVQKSLRSMAAAGASSCWLAGEGLSWDGGDSGKSALGRAIRSGRAEVDRDGGIDSVSAASYGAKLALPLSDGVRNFGALCVFGAAPDAFDDEEIRLFAELANNVAFGIVSLRTRADRDRIAHEHEHHEEILRKSLEDSIGAIADTVEMRDPYTAGHQRRVGELAAAIARELCLDDDRIHGIRLAASVHDLGKITVPAEILSKPTKLTDAEFMLIKTHARSGYDILKDIAFPWPIATVVLQHHERMDGSGYPQGLKGGQILLESRIMAVADVIEAMATHRPYRPSLGLEAALNEIERGRASAYDPDVVDACRRLIREGRFELPA